MVAARTATPFKRESKIEEKTKMAVEKAKGIGQSPSPTDKPETLAKRIQKRAFEIFENQGAGGRAVEDWFVTNKGDAKAFSDLCAALRSRETL
jgi:hypothetical protein